MLATHSKRLQIGFCFMIAGKGRGEGVGGQIPVPFFFKASDGGDRRKRGGVRAIHEVLKRRGGEASDSQARFANGGGGINEHGFEFSESTI